MVRWAMDSQGGKRPGCRAGGGDEGPDSLWSKEVLSTTKTGRGGCGLPTGAVRALNLTTGPICGDRAENLMRLLYWRDRSIA